MILAVFPLVVYGQLRNYGFIQFDDGSYVSENPNVITGLSWENVRWAFTPVSTEVSGNWHPLTWISLMLDAELFGQSPRGFHLTNLALHIANTLLLFALLRMMTGAEWESAFVAAVFSVHPLHVESVAWIAERKDVLSMFWGLIAMLCWTRFVQRGQRSWVNWSLLAYTLCLMSKQMLVTLPCLLLVLDYWPLQRLHDEGNSEARWKCWVTLTLEKLPHFGIGIVFCIIAWLSQDRGHTIQTLEDYSLNTRLLNAIAVYGLYLWNTVWPTGLAVFYPYPQHSLLFEAAFSGLLLITITVQAVRMRRQHPYVISGWLWYLGTLVPVIGIVQIGVQRMADRYTYFPMTGILIAVTWLISNSLRDSSTRRTIVFGAGTAVVFVLSICAHIQASLWRNTLTLFQHATTVEESALSRVKVGYEYVTEGDFREGTEHFRRALEIDPEYVSAHSCLGNTALSQRRLPEAVEHFRRAIHLDPDFVEAQFNLGIVLAMQGNTAEAITHYLETLRVEPRHAEANVNLGIAYRFEKRFKEAERYFRQALSIDPHLSQAHFNLAIILSEAGKPDVALSHMHAVLKNEPNNWQVHLRVAELYIRTLDRELAVRHARRAVQLNPNAFETQKLLDENGNDLILQ
jgi:Tfp pilus assembly protein PilF